MRRRSKQAPKAQASRGSGGMLPRKILKIRLRCLRLHFVPFEGNRI